MAIPEQLIDRIQEKTDIVEVISRYIPLKKFGRNYKAPCPFHNEKTPSFIVSPDKQIYHCFGCGAGGNVFSFLMRHENLQFPEVIEMLAEKCGVALPKGTFARVPVSRTPPLKVTLLRWSEFALVTVSVPPLRIVAPVVALAPANVSVPALTVVVPL